MLVVTNRNLVPRARSGEKKFGSGFNEAGPDELRLAHAKQSRGKWQVDILPDKDPNSGLWASEQAFLDLQARMKRLKRPCVLFVHGFNTDFEAVLVRGRRLELDYKVEVVAFTWPSNGRTTAAGRLGGVASYKSDKRDAARSVVAFDRTLEKLDAYLRRHQAATKACDQRVSLFMHSMGNYLFKHLMKSSVYQGETSLFDNVVLCAADVNNAGHASWLDRVAYRRRLYVTINEDDKALFASRAKFGEQQKARLGHYTQNLTSANAVYLDFTRSGAVDDSHSYFVGAPIKKNASVRRAFRLMLRGERAEVGLGYNAHSRTYAVP